MVKKGVGEWQLDRSSTAVQAITKVLMDGEWHRYQDLKEKSGLSSATLSKHLKELEEGIVEKKMHLDSGEYPYPVAYRIKEKYLVHIKQFDKSLASGIFTVIRFTKNGIKIERVQESLKTASDALGETITEAYRLALDDNNWKAFMQTVGTAIAFYNEALHAVVKKENT